MQNMQKNMQKNMQNMQAICRLSCYCSILHAICKICKIICTICKICKRHFQYAEYALPTLLMILMSVTSRGLRLRLTRSTVTVTSWHHHDLEPRFSVYTWYIQRISHVYAVLTDIHGIYQVYPSLIYHVYPTPGVDHHDHIPCISTRYIRGISMDIHWHGISFDVYSWYIRGISMDIPRFLNPDFSDCPCCWSLSMRTQVWVIRVFHSTRHHGNCARG